MLHFDCETVELFAVQLNRPRDYTADVRFALYYLGPCGSMRAVWPDQDDDEKALGMVHSKHPSYPAYHFKVQNTDAAMFGLAEKLRKHFAVRKVVIRWLRGYDPSRCAYSQEE